MINEDWRFCADCPDNYRCQIKCQRHEIGSSDPTASEEKAALEWLTRFAGKLSPENSGKPHTVVIQRLLAQPRLPAEPTEQMIRVMFEAGENFGKLRSEHWKDAYRALYAELTKPKTKTVWDIIIGEKLETAGISLNEASRWLAAIRINPITEIVTIAPREVPND